MTTIGPFPANRGPLPPTPAATDAKSAQPTPEPGTPPAVDRVDLRHGTAATVPTDDPQLAQSAKSAPQALLDAGAGALGAQAIPDDVLALLD